MKNNKSTFICFTGIDGSGKTTLAKSLSDYLNGYGFRYKYSYNRFSPFLLKPFMIVGRKIFLRGHGTSKNYVEYSAARRKTIKNNPLSYIYQLLLLFDYSLQTLFKIKIPLLFGKNIICDRYIYDTVVNDLAFDFCYSRKTIKNTVNKFFYFFPKPSIVFLVDVPEEVAFERKDDVSSIEYLKERRKIYLELKEDYKMVLLEGIKSLDELEYEIINRLCS